MTIFLKKHGLDKNELKKTKTNQYTSYFEKKLVVPNSSDSTEIVSTEPKRKEEDREAKSILELIQANRKKVSSRPFVKRRYGLF